VWLAFDLAARLVIGGSLLLAGLTKIISTVAWRQLWLACYRLLPRPLVRSAALALPTAELACGLAVLAGVLGPASLLAGAGLLALLATAVATAMVREPEISCHCLNMTGEVISWRGVIRNLILAAAAAAAGWHGGADLLGSTGAGWPAQLGCLGAVALAVHGAMLTVRASRRRRALAAIAGRPAVPAPGLRG
jgi:Methylamine utilisation protein MauE